MSFKHFMQIHSTVYGLFALALFFVPTLLWPLYGVQVNDDYAYFLSQHNSIFLGGVAIIGFMLRDLDGKSHTAKQLLKGLLGTNLLGVVITLYACLTGVFVGFGWSDPAFFALLSLLSAWQIKQISTTNASA